MKLATFILSTTLLQGTLVSVAYSSDANLSCQLFTHYVAVVDRDNKVVEMNKKELSTFSTYLKSRSFTEAKEEAQEEGSFNLEYLKREEIDPITTIDVWVKKIKTSKEDEGLARVDMEIYQDGEVVAAGKVVHSLEKLDQESLVISLAIPEKLKAYRALKNGELSGLQKNDVIAYEVSCSQRPPFIRQEDPVIDAETPETAPVDQVSADSDKEAPVKEEITPDTGDEMVDELVDELKQDEKDDGAQVTTEFPYP